MTIRLGAIHVRQRTWYLHAGTVTTSSSVMVRFLLLVAFCILSSVGGMTATPDVFPECQPDGTRISLLLRGDERRHWMTDTEDYIVLKTVDGSFVYVEEAEAEKGGNETSRGFVPSLERLVGNFHPKQFQNDATLARHQTLQMFEFGDDDVCVKRICGGVPEPSVSATEYNIFQRSDGNNRNLRGTTRHGHSRHLLSDNPGPQVHRRQSALPTSGTVRNLVILLQFIDHRRIRRVLPSLAALESHMESVKELFLENSFGQLTIESTIIPTWHATRYSESWYADNLSGSTNLHEAIRDTLDYLDDNNIVNFSDFDANGDGYVDMLTVLHSGYGAEHGATDCKGSHYLNRIWTHQWELFGDRNGSNIGPFVSSDNIKVWKYQMAPVLWGRCGNSLAHVGAIAHEIGHSLGLPDLNDGDGSGNGIGGYDLMSDPWGFDRSQQRPSQLSAWSKMKLGWLQPQRPAVGINTIGYAEEPSSLVQLYKIGDGEFNFPPNEYLLIEYRAKKRMDSDLPGEGLMIYHVDESQGSNNNEGHPWQDDGFPANGKHYMVALLQADRLYSLERGINSGGSGDFFNADYIDNLMPSTDSNAPANGPFPNTDRYQNGNVAQTGVQIYDISTAGGSTMSFSFQRPETTYVIYAEDEEASNYDTNTDDTNIISSKNNLVP